MDCPARQLCDFFTSTILLTTDFCGTIPRPTVKTTNLMGSRTKHPGTKHPMPFFDTPDKTSHKDLPPRTKHPMLFLSPRTKHPMLFLSPRTKHPMPLLPPRTKHPTLRLLLQGKSHFELSSTIACTSSECPSKDCPNDIN